MFHGECWSLNIVLTQYLHASKYQEASQVVHELRLIISDKEEFDNKDDIRDDKFSALCEETGITWNSIDQATLQCSTTMDNGDTCEMEEFQERYPDGPTDNMFPMTLVETFKLKVCGAAHCPTHLIHGTHGTPWTFTLSYQVHTHCKLMAKVGLLDL